MDSKKYYKTKDNLGSSFNAMQFIRAEYEKALENLNDSRKSCHDKKRDEKERDEELARQIDLMNRKEIKKEKYKQYVHENSLKLRSLKKRLIDKYETEKIMMNEEIKKNDMNLNAMEVYKKHYEDELVKTLPESIYSKLEKDPRYIKCVKAESYKMELDKQVVLKNELKKRDTAKNLELEEMHNEHHRQNMADNENRKLEEKIKARESMKENTTFLQMTKEMKRKEKEKEKIQDKFDANISEGFTRRLQRTPHYQLQVKNRQEISDKLLKQLENLQKFSNDLEDYTSKINFYEKELEYSDKIKRDQYNKSIEKVQYIREIQNLNKMRENIKVENMSKEAEFNDIILKMKPMFDEEEKMKERMENRKEYIRGMAAYEEMQNKIKKERAFEENLKNLITEKEHWALEKYEDKEHDKILKNFDFEPKIKKHIEKIDLKRKLLKTLPKSIIDSIKMK